MRGKRTPSNENQQRTLTEPVNKYKCFSHMEIETQKQLVRYLYSYLLHMHLLSSDHNYISTALLSHLINNISF
jgi:hypothetical protein